MDKKGLKAANDGLIIDLSYLVLLWRSLFSYCQALLVSPNEALLIYSGLFWAPLKLKLSPTLWPLHLFSAQLNFFAMTKFFFLIEKKLKPLLIERVCIDDGTSGFLRPRRDFWSRNLHPEKRKFFHSLEMQVAYWSAALVVRSTVV